MNKLSLLFSMLKLPALLPIIPYLGIGICVAGIGFGIHKLYKEKKYHTDIKEQKITYEECMKNAMSYNEVQKCYLIQQQEVNK